MKCTRACVRAATCASGVSSSGRSASPGGGARARGHPAVQGISNPSPSGALWQRRALTPRWMMCVRQTRSPQHTNTANGNATNSDKHTNGHGSVGAYDTARTPHKPHHTQAARPGTEWRRGCTASGLHPPPASPPRPTHSPSRCIAPAIRLRAAQPIGLHPPPMGPSFW